MDPSLAALAQMLKTTQGRRVEENRPAASNVMIHPASGAAPPPTPSFANVLSPIAEYMKEQQRKKLLATAMPAPTPPVATPPVVPPGNQPGVVPPMPPPVNVGAAPGMSPPGMAAPNMVAMPQTGPDLEAWRKMMDQMQFARQGA